MLFGKKVFTEEGQGLVEYALILVLVAIVVIAILLQLGPAVSDVFAQVADALGYSSITNVSVERGGPGNSQKVIVTIAVSTNTTVTLTDAGGTELTPPMSCSGSCGYTFTNPNAGSVTVTAEAGGRRTVSYPAK
jgi:pilus assembly protein Flp/PilA